MKEIAVKVRDHQMLCHLNMSKYHHSKEAGVFECEGLPLHGKRFIKESQTKVVDFYEFGKSTYAFYLDEPDSIVFTSLIKLISHYTRGKDGKQIRTDK